MLLVKINYKTNIKESSYARYAKKQRIQLNMLICECVKKVVGRCPSEEGIGQLNELRS